MGIYQSVRGLREVFSPIYWLILFACAIPALVGCAGLVKPLTPFNLQETGWTLREGQAIWQPDEKAPELVGEIVLATHSDGRTFVQFSKGLPIVHSQRDATQWQVAFPPENREYRGRGKPPKRIIWLYLPELFQGGNAPDGWSVVAQTAQELEIVQQQRGERLRVIFQ